MAEPKIPYKDKRTDDQVKVDRTKARDQSQKFTQGRSRMQEIIGGVGESLYDFLVPSSVEDVALDMSPLGKLAGLIPAKYIRPIVARLKDRVLNNPTVPYKDLIEEQIDRYPNVAAHIGNFGDLSESPHLTPEQLRYSAGGYSALNDYSLERLAAKDDQFLDSLATGEQKLGSKLMLNKEFFDSASQGKFDGIIPKEWLDSTSPESTLRHEMTHAAQDAMVNRNSRSFWDTEGPYMSRPIEIGARYAQTPKGWSFEDRINKVLAEITAPSPTEMDRFYEQMGNVDRRLALRGYGVFMTADGPRVKKLDPRIMLDKP